MSIDNKFVFVSYSHLDEDQVKPLVELMAKTGIALWRDKNINVGTEWADTLQKKMESCDRLVAFVTKNFLTDEDCNKQIVFAHTTLYKEILVVCLEDVQEALDNDDTGIDMLLSSRQWIYRENADSESVFLEKLVKAKFFDPCRERVVLEENINREIGLFLCPNNNDTPVTPAPQIPLKTKDLSTDNEDLPPLIASTISFGTSKFKHNNMAETSPCKSINMVGVSAVKFSCKTVMPFTEATDLPIEINIYNTKNECVFHNSNVYSFSPSISDFSFEWEIKNEKGLNVFEEGQYCAVISSDGFKAFRYDFSIFKDKESDPDRQKKIRELKNHINHHKLMMLKLYIWGLWLLLFVSTGMSDIGALATLGAAVGIFMFQKKVFALFLEMYNRSKLISFIIVIPLGLFYGVYQVSLGLAHISTYKSDLKTLQELEQEM